MAVKALRVFLLLLLISGLLSFAGSFTWFKKVEGVVKQPFSFSRGKIFSAYQEFWAWFENLAWQLSPTGYQQKMAKLEGQVRQLALDQNALSICLQENQQIKKLLGSPLPPGWKFLMAKVSGGRERIIIDKGRKDGVKNGMIAVSENILVGRVVGVEETTSQIQLLDSPASKIAVSVRVPVTRGGLQPSVGITAKGVLKGGGNSLSLEKVLQEESLQEGDLVVSVNQGGWLADLVIGQIEEVQGSSAEVWKKAKVRPLVDYQSLTYLFLVIP